MHAYYTTNPYISALILIQIYFSFTFLIITGRISLYFVQNNSSIVKNFQTFSWINIDRFIIAQFSVIGFSLIFIPCARFIICVSVLYLKENRTEQNKKFIEYIYNTYTWYLYEKKEKQYSRIWKAKDVVRIVFNLTVWLTYV